VSSPKCQRTVVSAVIDDEDDELDSSRTGLTEKIVAAVAD
jgi:hypothetical protein